MSDEQEAQRRGLGKWGRAGVPRKGWDNVDWYDCGGDDMGPAAESRRQCEMCETVMIRYVHVMRHADYQRRVPTDKAGRKRAFRMAMDLDNLQMISGFENGSKGASFDGADQERLFAVLRARYIE
jgi:hypothetical protein